MNKLLFGIALLFSASFIACNSEETNREEEQMQHEELHEDRDSLLEQANKMGDSSAMHMNDSARMQMDTVKR